MQDTAPLDDKLASEIIEQNIALHEASAELYDLSHPELRHWFERRLLAADLDLLTSLLRGVDAPLALDIGAGTGRLSLEFLHRGLDCLAVDNSPAMLAVLKRRCEALAAPKGALQTVVAGADDFDPEVLAGRPVYLIGFSSVLHHLPDYLGVLAKLAALLAPGGLIYITHEPLPAQVPGRTLPTKVVRAMDQVLRAPGQVRKAVVKRKYHLPPLPPAALVDYHDKAGLDIAAITSLLAAQGLQVVRQRAYKDHKTGVMAYLDTSLLHTPNWRFRLIACKPVAGERAEPGQAGTP